MDFSSFDLEKTAAPNYMGLSGTVAGTKGLVVGWDSKEYTLELEDGRRVKTADFVWEYETLADEDIMEDNARVAALRSESSPYQDEGRLSYDPITGAWTITSADVLEEESDPEFGGIDDGEANDGTDAVDGDGWPDDSDSDDSIVQTMSSILDNFDDMYQQHVNEHGDDSGFMNHPAIQALPYLILCASDPDIDGSDVPEIQNFLQYLDQTKEPDDEDDPDEGHDSVHETFEAHVKQAGPLMIAEAGIPLAEAAAPLAESAGLGSAISGMSGLVTKIPGASKAAPLFNSAMKSLGMSSLMGGLVGGGGQQPDPIQVQRQQDFSYSSVQPEHHFLAAVDRFEKQAKDGDDLIDAMRAQVDSILKAIAPNMKDIQLDPNAMWYVLYDSMTNAQSVSQLQSILQCIPEEYHNVQPAAPDLSEEGAQTPAPIALPSATPGNGRPKLPGGNAPSEPVGPVANPLGGGPLVPSPGGGPTPPPGTAPGGGIPGGPGRRGPVSSVQKEAASFEGDPNTPNGSEFNQNDVDSYRHTLPGGGTSDAWIGAYPIDEQPFLAAIESYKRKGFTDGEIVTKLTDDPWYSSAAAQAAGATPPHPQQILYFLKEVEQHFAANDMPSPNISNSDNDFMLDNGIKWTKFMDELGVKQSDVYNPLGMPAPTTPAQTGTPPVTFGLGNQDADQKVKIEQLAQNYMAKGMAAPQAYQQAALNLSQQQPQPNQQVTPGINVTSPAAPNPYGVTSAAQGMSELPIDQDGKKMADLKCPRCGGHTIGYAGDNDFVCRTCGKEFSMPTKEDKVSSVEGVTELPTTDNNMATIKCPNCGSHTVGYGGDDTFICRACRNKFTEKVESSGARTSSWNDVNGNKLEVGKVYKMTHPSYPVPDFVKVTWIEPENIRVGFVSNGTEDDIHSNEYEFEPIEDDGIKTASSDLDWLKESSESEEPLVAPEVMEKLAGKSFNHQEQRSFIDEEGKARNRDKLNLKGTHYHEAPKEIESSGQYIDPDQFLIG